MSITYHYHCPHCNNMLCPGGIISLVATRGPKRILIGFPPEPGNYALYTPPGITFNHGDTWDFACPVCHKDLLSRRHGNLCELVLYENGIRKTVLFSRVAGERATYVLKDDEHRPSRHGEHNDRYNDDTIDITVESP